MRRVVEGRAELSVEEDGEDERDLHAHRGGEGR